MGQRCRWTKRAALVNVWSNMAVKPKQLKLTQTVQTTFDDDLIYYRRVIAVFGHFHIKPLTDHRFDRQWLSLIYRTRPVYWYYSSEYEIQEA